MQKKFILLITTLALFSCGSKNEPAQPQNGSGIVAIDSVAVLTDLNIQTTSFTEIDSSGIIMFPLSMSETGRGSGGLLYKEIPSSSYWNIIFHNTVTSANHLLSDRKMLIRGYDTKYSSNDNIDLIYSTRYIFYRVTVEDYNQDKKLTYDDPEYLFISDKEGNNFRQISPAGYNLNSWQFIKSANKVVMTVTRDSDKNKKFGDKDEITAFQIDMDKETQPSEIFSSEFKTKLTLMFDRDWKLLKK